MLCCFSCVWLCEPMNCSPPSSSVRGISQARILEWVAIPFSRGSSRPRDRTWASHIADGFLTIWATREGPILTSGSSSQTFLWGNTAISLDGAVNQSASSSAGQMHALFLTLQLSDKVSSSISHVTSWWFLLSPFLELFPTKCLFDWSLHPRIYAVFSQYTLFNV